MERYMVTKILRYAKYFTVIEIADSPALLSSTSSFYKFDMLVIWPWLYWIYYFFADKCVDKCNIIPWICWYFIWGNIWCEYCVFDCSTQSVLNLEFFMCKDDFFCKFSMCSYCRILNSLCVQMIFCKFSMCSYCQISNSLCVQMIFIFCKFSMCSFCIWLPAVICYCFRIWLESCPVPLSLFLLVHFLD